MATITDGLDLGWRYWSDRLTRKSPRTDNEAVRVAKLLGVELAAGTVTDVGEWLWIAHLDGYIASGHRKVFAVMNLIYALHD